MRQKLNSKWGNVKVCPMIPFWNESIPGEMHRVIWEIGTAFSSLFGSDPRGMRTSWDTLKIQLKNITPHTPHIELNTYTLPYPATHESLTEKNTQITHLHAQRQCPSDAGWLQVVGRRDLPGLQHHLVQAAEYSQAAQKHNSSAK